MTPILNQIGKQNRKLFAFSIVKDKIKNTVDIINRMGIDPTIIMDKNKKKEAFQLLSTIFRSITSRQFNQLINKCYISEDGKLMVKENL